jgi:alcohol dehydrogenase (cytochrome c)
MLTAKEARKRMTIRQRRIASVVGSCLVAVIWSGALRKMGAQSAATPVSFTSAQASDGHGVYLEQCASCHGQYLDDGEFARPLKGVDFRARWGSRSTEALFTYLSTKMPPDRPGTLGDTRYAQLLAFILQENGAQPGERELPREPNGFKELAPPNWPPVQGGGVAPGVTIPPPPPRANPLDRIRAVTDTMLNKVPDGDWLLWRRTYDAAGFSPLKTINRSNVKDLRVAWTWSLPGGANESTPIVHDGVLFVHGFGDKVQALDAATGDFLWQYSRPLPKGVAPSIKRGLSIYGNRLYVPTSDAHLVALDVKTGHVIWDTEVADTKSGYRVTGGPLVARGKVMIGTTGRAAGGNFVAALDAETGKEAWRFYTLARPGAGAVDTWNGLPLEKRNGGSVWIPGSYDPVQNLAFFAPGNTYDTAPLRTPVQQAGVTNDGLYLDSTLALNPETGQLHWYFQHQSNGQWDLDWAFERLIAQLPVNGQVKSVVVTAGKQAIFDVVDTETGKYFSSLDMGLQNVVTSIDPKTGVKSVNADLVPGDGKTKMVCPHVGGGRGWHPTSYDPTARIIYVPIVEACMDLVPVEPGERGSLSTGVRWTVRPRPESDGKYGRLQAINFVTKQTVWVERQRAPLTTGTLATAGGLVFVGSLDRSFGAHDAATGALLWKTRLNDVPSSAPISYSAAGQEYIAVIVGPGGFQSNAYLPLVPEIQNPPDHGAALWVFEAPAKTPVNAGR